MTRIRFVAAALVASATIGVAPATATTPLNPDGNAHRNVGILVAEWLTPGVKDRVCSGTLIAPRIFLTRRTAMWASPGFRSTSTT
jgi:hypothetical protein